MTTINNTPASADELGTLLAQIATLTKQADALKDAEDITDWGGWRNYLEADIVATGKVATGKPKQKRA